MVKKYWKNAVRKAAEKLDIPMTDQQIKLFAESMEFAHENYKLSKKEREFSEVQQRRRMFRRMVEDDAKKWGRKL